MPEVLRDLPVFAGGDLDVVRLARPACRSMPAASARCTGDSACQPGTASRSCSIRSLSARAYTCGVWKMPTSPPAYASTTRPWRNRATGTAGDRKAPAQPHCRALSMTCRNSARLANGRAASCTSSQSPRACAASKAMPSWRVAPPAITRHRGNTAAVASTRSAGTATSTSSATCMALSASQHSNGRPANSRKSIGPRPRRSPAPPVSNRNDRPARASLMTPAAQARGSVASMAARKIPAAAPSPSAWPSTHDATISM